MRLSEGMQKAFSRKRKKIILKNGQKRTFSGRISLFIKILATMYAFARAK